MSYISKSSFSFITSGARDTKKYIFREKEEKGAVLTHISKRHIPVGTFRFSAKWGTLNVEVMKF